MILDNDILRFEILHRKIEFSLVPNRLTEKY